MTLSIIIPWQDRGDPARKKSADYVINHYQNLDIGEVVIGTYPMDGEPLNRSRLRNEGAKLATGDVFAFIDAEILVPTDQILKSAEMAAESPGIVFPADHQWAYPTRLEMAQIVAGEPFENFLHLNRTTSYRRQDGNIKRGWEVSPASTISREGFDIIGGWDEDFVGWGEEDREYNWRAAHHLAPLRLVPGGLMHVNFTTSDEKDDVLIYYQKGTEENRLFEANVKRFEEKVLAMRRPKIAVYAPAKDEEANVKEWAASATEADILVLTDTGSSDQTVQVARDAGVLVREARIMPWRFDDGFNAALANVPDDVDICICLHLDERLEPGWRKALERAWLKHGDRYSFNYQWSKDISFTQDRIHSRHGLRWRYPVHEVLEGEGRIVPSGVKIVQHQDLSKDRSQDMRLLELMMLENKEDSRPYFYFGRYLFQLGEWPQARAMFDKYLELSKYDQERSQVCIHQSEMVWPEEKEKWLLRAVAECPERRETWYHLALYYKEQGMVSEMRGAAERLLRIKTLTDKNMFLVMGDAWNDTKIKADFLETKKQRGAMVTGTGGRATVTAR